MAVRKKIVGVNSFKREFTQESVYNVLKNKMVKLGK